MKHAIVIMVLLALTGCKLDPPQSKHDCPPVEAIVTRWSDPGKEFAVRVGQDIAFIASGQGADCAVEVSAYEDGVVRVKIGQPRVALNRSGLPNTSTANRPELPDSSAVANKVAQVMAANDITLPQVAAYLHAYGFDVINRTAWKRVHWRPSPVTPATPRPTYYLLRPHIAVADTVVEFMVRGNISGAWPADVRGVLVGAGGAITYGPYSEIGWSDGGTGAGAMPGILPEARE